MDTPDVIGTLEAKAKALEAQAAALAEEASRYRDAVNLIRGEPKVSTHRPSASTHRVPARSGGGKKGPNTTMSVVRRVLAESGHLTVAEMTARMFERGWDTQSTNPENTLRGALGRMEERGEVVRTSDGLYRAPRGGEPEHSFVTNHLAIDDDDTER